MVNQLVVNLVNSVIGHGKPTARGNQAHICPLCNHHKPKLEINFDENAVTFRVGTVGFVMLEALNYLVYLKR
jgi:hypothetical protein